MAKTKRASDELNVALSQITAAAAIMEGILKEPTPNKDMLGNALKQLRLGSDKAFDSLRIIRNAAESI